MIGNLIALLIILLILGILYWAFTQIPLPIPPWIINVIFAILAIIVIYDLFLGSGHIARFRL